MFKSEIKLDGNNQTASTIAVKSSFLRAAPPISPPSTSGFEKISAAFEGLQLPP
jgi:hypothetical protein